MNFAILDNDKLFVEKITKILEDNYPNCKVKGFQNTTSLLESEVLFDILFLDIGLPNVNGSEFACNYVYRFPFIIYVTSHIEYMQDAFGRNIVGFIPKDNNFEESLTRRVLELKRNLLKRKRLQLKTKDGLFIFKSNDILYFEFENANIYVHTLTKKYRLTITSLHKLSEQLGESFCLVNRNAMININHIQHFVKNKHEVFLSNELCFKVSNRKWKLLLNECNKWEILHS